MFVRGELILFPRIERENNSQIQTYIYVQDTCINLTVKICHSCDALYFQICRFRVEHFFYHVFCFFFKLLKTKWETPQFASEF